MLLGFQQRFEKKILAKEKRHTIRDRRKGKRQILVGDRLDCYVNPRKKSMRLMGRWPCTRVQDIQIKARRYAFLGTAYRIRIDGVLLRSDELEQLAISDGFSSFRDMMEFWRGRLPFRGDMIHWDPDRPQPGPKKKGRRKK